MYSQGETFKYEIEGEELELEVIENLAIRGNEYIITEDLNGAYHVFYYDDDLDEIEYLDEEDGEEIVDYWENEYLSGDNIGDFDEDEYYDREDESFEPDYDEEFTPDEEDIY